MINVVDKEMLPVFQIKDNHSIKNLIFILIGGTVN